MSPSMWLALIGGAVLVFLLYRAVKTPLSKVVDAAVENQEIGAILDAIGELRDSARPAGYHRAIRRLWDKYHRPLAADLVKELARKHAEIPIAQYWLKQVITVEPALARSKFTKKFLRTYYQPEIAAKCYHVG
jgi:hypothetical protein